MSVCVCICGKGWWLCGIVVMSWAQGLVWAPEVPPGPLLLHEKRP